MVARDIPFSRGGLPLDLRMTIRYSDRPWFVAERFSAARRAEPQTTTTALKGSARNRARVGAECMARTTWRTPSVSGFKGTIRGESAVVPIHEPAPAGPRNGYPFRSTQWIVFPTQEPPRFLGGTRSVASVDRGSHDGKLVRDTSGSSLAVQAWPSMAGFVRTIRDQAVVGSLPLREWAKVRGKL
jgi:hypothetical protein